MAKVMDNLVEGLTRKDVEEMIRAIVPIEKRVYKQDLRSAINILRTTVERSSKANHPEVKKKFKTLTILQIVESKGLFSFPNRPPKRINKRGRSRGINTLLRDLEYAEANTKAIASSPFAFGQKVSATPTQKPETVVCPKCWSTNATKYPSGVIMCPNC